MTSFLKNLFVLVWCVCSFSCERAIELNLRNEKPTLVIEGTITNQPPPYTILLSYSGPYSVAGTISPDLFINDALVTIEDDLGKVTSCVNIDRGTYLTTDLSFIGTIGRTYQIKVILKNNKTYWSTGEKMQPVGPIKKVHVVLDNSFTIRRPTRFVISVDAQDPVGSRDFYRWKAITYLPRKATGVICGIGCLLGEYCLQLYHSDKVSIRSDKLIDGNMITDQEVLNSPIYWFGKHFIQIDQYSLTQSAYLFWEKYKDQVSRTGSIGDPLPAPVEGNVANITDPSDRALGYFGASAVFTKRVTILPFYLKEYLLRSIAGQYIGKGDCSLLYPNAFYNYSDLADWADAEVIEVH